MAELLITMLIAVPLLIGAALVINVCRLRDGRRNQGTGCGHQGGGCGCSSALQQKIGRHQG